MDESAFREARRALERHPCAFAKPLLAGHCRCSCARPHALAERESISCRSAAASAACARFRALLRDNAGFALRLAPGERVLSHAKQMKLECGGLTGLALALDREGGVADVCDLVEAAGVLFGGIESAPYSEIMRAVAAFAPRRRGRPDPP
ncbi:MAG: hypothetical protein OHK0026_13320 [Rhodocyclaceae bacterium]